MRERECASTLLRRRDNALFNGGAHYDDRSKLSGVLWTAVELRDRYRRPANDDIGDVNCVKV